MDSSTLKKRALWITGTLLVGALGSGLWEAALKPSFVWSGTFILDIATLGISSLRDGLYVDVAKGTYERAALSMMGLVFGGLAGLSIGTLIRRFRRDNARGESHNRRRRWIMMAMMISFPMILFIQFFRVNYIVRAANHLEQMKRIVAPYVSNEQLAVFDSRIAQMQTRQEYILVTGEMHSIAAENGARIPDFSIY